MHSRERLHFRPAELVDPARRRLALERIGDGARDVAREHRLQACLAAADHRKDRREAGKPGEPVEELVLRPEDEGRPHHHGIGQRLQDGCLAGGLAPAVGGRRLGIRAERRDVHQGLDAGRAGRLGDGAGAEDIDRVEALAAGIAEDGDEVDHRIGADDGAVDRPAIAQVGLHRLNPADLAERLQVAGEIGAANRGAHAPAALEKRPHDVAAEKPGAAEDGDQSALGDGDRHDASAILSAAPGARRLISIAAGAVQRLRVPRPRRTLRAHG